MVASIEALPPELYTAIIDYIPAQDVQQTVLSLTRAIPLSPIPLYHLFERVRLKYSDQVVHLYRRLRKSAEDAACVHHFSLETWKVDADVVVNLVAILPQLSHLSLFIGPNFAPEHLEEMFEDPMQGLKFISLRFRPYVQTATYYQFLKGAYFDSTLTAFSRWPADNLPTLSIVQDPLDPSIAPNKFAQPLVFFRLDPLSQLARSPFVENLVNFRLRIPARQGARFLYAFPRSLPKLQSLDMSTSKVAENDVESMLARFGNLKTLVLDGCFLVSQRADGQDAQDAFSHWVTLGKIMSLAGVKYAREREKKLKEWLEVNHAQATLAALRLADGTDSLPEPEPEPARRRARRGRRGVSTATISLRNSPPRPSAALPAISSSSALSSKTPAVPRVRIFPAIATIRSIATTAPAFVGVEKHAEIRAEFERGWEAGIAQISTIYGRLRQSWRNGIRVVKTDDDFNADGEGSEVGFNGLKDVVEEDFDVDVDGEVGKCPSLCLAGPGRSENHVDGCGHQVGWEVFQDEL
ncbi:uncharacterized protein FIBRA_00093 [Fibroporia radiculosa]|uniref:F-box domain-containing protein n=1 Tax=Fibroporia radiculosa TaxID=599839 RepID=J7S5M1_9APHY|nr:uncharacterized protein FIBRA_00093 [Fibroporia radiculosa]CCL98099.1 predicted protein [Fibroporia radiculosa]